MHTDRKAPIVAVSVWYDVGSTFEPRGRTGFAHLFEHLMFNGSEHAPGDYFSPLRQAGATDVNGNTDYDYTNYYETVPTAALPRALFLESDRMGYLLGAVTQGVLDEQRGVVRNEKRQREGQPYGLLGRATGRALFPADHPHGHDPMGSIADLDAASLGTVRDWFHDHYAPNNAVLVLAGDIDVATARPLVERYFGAIPRGRDSVRPAGPVAAVAQDRTLTVHDRVAAPMLTRNWIVPGRGDPDTAALEVAAGVLGGAASARLTEQLVRREQLFTQVSATDAIYTKLGVFSIGGMVRAGVDPALAAARLDAAIARFLRDGPTTDEVTRYATTALADHLRSMESVNSKAATLAQGTLYADDPGFYRRRLAALAAQTPASVRATANRWLGRPRLAVDVVPGARDGEEAVGASPPAPPAVASAPPSARSGRGAMPGVGAIEPFRWPAVSRARLRNGIAVVHARRAEVPLSRIVLSFDAGHAADPPGKAGIGQATLDTLVQGTTTRNAAAIARTRDALGAMIGNAQSLDRTTVFVDVPSANLTPAVGLLADLVRHPAFAEADVARIRTQQLGAIGQELSGADGIANRLMRRVVADGTPYALAQGSGDPAAVAVLTRADLAAFHAAWLRPEKATIYVVSSRPAAEVLAALEARFGDWRGTGAMQHKRFAAAPPSTQPRILLYDRPGGTQALVVGMVSTPLKGADDLLPVTIANDALGGNVLSRINMDLREDKHWTYGVAGGFQRAEHAVPYVVRGSVELPRTGESIAALRRNLADYVTTKPMTEAEFELAVDGAIRSAAGHFERSGAVLAAMQQNDLYRRSDDYPATLVARYRALTLPQVRGAIARAIDPARFTWIVVGDAAAIRPQFDALGLPVESVAADAIGQFPPEPSR